MYPKMDSQSLIRFLVPLIIAFIVTYLFPMSKTSGSAIAATPPAYVFGLVWTVLYTFIGISWSNVNPITPEIDYGFIALNLILATWVITYTKAGAKPAVYVLLVILASVGFLIWYLTIQNQYVSTGLLQPLFYWCLFALLLNFTQVNMIPVEPTI
jgi:tryptophan-rich sensory protein